MFWTVYIELIGQSLLKTPVVRAGSTVLYLSWPVGSLIEKGTSWCEVILRASFLQKVIEFPSCSLLHRKDLPLFLCPFYILIILWIVQMFLINSDVKYSKIAMKKQKWIRTRREQLLIYRFTLFTLNTSSSNRSEYIPKYYSTEIITFLIALLAPWHFFLLVQTKAFPILEMMLFLNMPPQLLVLHLYLHWISWSQSALFYFAESQGFLGWSRIASLCFGHRTVALLSFSFSPSDFCFLLAFLYLLSVAGIKGVGYPGYPVLTVTSSCGPRNGLFEQASNNGVPESEAAPFLAGTCIRTSAVSELPLHETPILSSQPLLDVIIFCGQSKNGNVLHLKTEE